MRSIVRAILRLYPASWRERYGNELYEITVDGRIGIGVLVDLARGALDARLHPGLAPAAVGAAPAVGPAAIVATTAREHAASPVAPGIVGGAGAGIVSRRAFMRRMLGAGVGLLSIQFIGGTLSFLWPRPSGALGREHAVGTVSDIIGIAPEWSRGRPWEYRAAGAFIVNVPAAMAMARGEELVVTDPGRGEILALWRKCPHLGCMIPNACEGRGRFQCYCHQSTYNILGEKLELGPAPRGMDRFPVRIDRAGVVHVDTREVIAGPPRGRVTFDDGWPANEGCA